MLHLFLASYACAPAPGSWPVEPLALRSERPLEGGVDAVAVVGQAELIALDAGALWRQAPGEDAAPLDLELASLSAATRLPDLGLLVAGDGALWSLGELPQEAPLTAALGASPSQLLLVDGALRIATEDGLYRWKHDLLQRVEVDGAPVTGPFAPGARLDGRAVDWVRAGDELVALSYGGEVQARAVLSGLPAGSMATGPGGALWAEVEGALLVVGPGGSLSWPLADATLEAVYGVPGAVGVWLDTSEGWMLGTQGALFALDGAPRGELQVDGAGRLVSLYGGEVERWSTDLHLALHGLTPGETLTEARALTSDLTGAELTLLVDGEPHGEGLLIDPSALTPEEHVAALSAWIGGQELRSPEVPFVADGLGEVTWAQHVGPLYEGRCARCHDNGTETQLGSAERFAEHVEQVLIEVRAGRMPIGDDPLSEGEIALIELWVEGGFQ